MHEISTGSRSGPGDLTEYTKVEGGFRAFQINAPAGGGVYRKTSTSRGCSCPVTGAEYFTRATCAALRGLEADLCACRCHARRGAR